MRRSALVCLLCIVAVASWPSSVRAQQPNAPIPARAEQAPAQDPPAESLFNDRLRKFKFDLEHVVATAETAEAFVLRYGQSDNPRILGAYPDPHANALIVIGPPEAEQAIREHLAQIVVDGQGGASLPLQLRLLQQQRRGLLEEMAGLEIQQAEVAANGPPSAEQTAKAQQFADRLQLFERKVQLVERQIEIVRKYQGRASREHSSDSDP
jgi:hypothetical protein